MDYSRWIETIHSVPLSVLCTEERRFASSVRIRQRTLITRIPLSLESLFLREQRFSPDVFPALALFTRDSSQ